tara:strand:- start:574 stop:1188 length:615 start_codon:yes stop_codon:yes gene_type:complete
MKYLGEGRSLHGYLDRSFDEYNFQDEDDNAVVVTIFEDGEIDVTWAGALDFTGTEKEFIQQYPDLAKHLFDVEIRKKYSDSDRLKDIVGKLKEGYVRSHIYDSEVECDIDWLVSKMQTAFPIPMTLELMKQIYITAEELTLEEFSEILKETNNANDDYIKGAFQQYHRTPLAYMWSRNPTLQGEKLFELVMKKVRENAENSNNQ